jgi:hypothetical protein
VAYSQQCRKLSSVQALSNPCSLNSPGSILARRPRSVKRLQTSVMWRPNSASTSRIQALHPDNSLPDFPRLTLSISCSEQTTPPRNAWYSSRNFQRCCV